MHENLPSQTHALQHVPQPPTQLLPPHTSLTTLPQPGYSHPLFQRHCPNPQAHLWQLGRLMPPALCAHLESCGILPSLYAASWLMTCYSADFPTSFSARWVDTGQ